MLTGNEFYDNLPNNEKEKFKILFEPKDSWYNKNPDGTIDYSKTIIEKYISEKYDNAIKNFIQLQISENTYDLSYIYFHLFIAKDAFGSFSINKSISFHSVVFNGLTIFTDTVFENNIDFSIAIFNGNVFFKNTKFQLDANLKITQFNGDTNFENTLFSHSVDFKDAIFNGETDFAVANFRGYTNFINVKFNDDTIFSNAIFNSDTNFKLSNFAKYVNFRSATFKKVANFDEAIFENKVSFWGAKFHDKVHFDSTDFRNIFNFTKTQINKITLVNTNVENANLLEISAYDETNSENSKPLTANNFANKESARLIKAHFEKQNNITEANKYFVIEQEKYIEDLRDKKNKTENSKIKKLIPLYFSKYVSNFGTDWIRGILLLLIIGILGYSITNIFKANETVFNINLFLTSSLVFLGYYLTFKDTKLKPIFAFIISISLIINMLLSLGIDNNYFSFESFKNNLIHINNIIKIINPINAFKDDDTFKGYEAFGMLVRVVSATIIYQIIVAFRQNTRRS